MNINTLPNLYQDSAYTEIVNRITSLTPATQHQWGKMTVSQMLVHCHASLSIPLTEGPVKRLFIGRLISWIFKKQYLNERPLRRHSPTAPDFVIEYEPNFEDAKAKLLYALRQFHERGPATAEGKMSPFFGKLTADEWARMQYKHLNHHLTQFGS